MAEERIGRGEIGGKAQGLARIEDILSRGVDGGAFPEFIVDIPWYKVIATDWFDAFMQRNRLYDVALSDTRDEHLANAFQRADLPAELVAELRGIATEVQAPLAIRSSSLLEDALQEPFAGVYATKMIPNNQFSIEARLRTLVEGVKFVYASTFSRGAKSYRLALGREDGAEKMAVMIQEVVGCRHGDRFYPHLSGVARSHNFYTLGHARPEHGVISLALGLGKTVVDGGRTWTYCPAFPKAKPPFGSTKELLSQTQTRFWSVNMGRPPTYDPARETEYLLEGDLRHAEEDGVLRYLASTYDPQSDRIIMGTGRPGPRVLDFGPLLAIGDIPLNGMLRSLLAVCEESLRNAVEIEFAVNLGRGPGERARLGFLQVRPMLVSKERVTVQEHELHEDTVLVASEQVLGNGQIDSIADIVYVRRDVFSAKDTWLIAAELDDMNRLLLEAGRPYLLVVIGRLGTVDPWLGIPVKWGQVSGAKVVVEAATPEMNVDMSQGSHFFHNITCLRILYFSAGRGERRAVDWEWLEARDAVHESRYVRHVMLDKPLHIKVDGSTGWGVIYHERSNQVGD